LEAPMETCDTLKRKGTGYSLTGITSGVVKKRQVGKRGKTCGIFTKDWPEWLTVESAFDLDLDWVYVREDNVVANLVSLYPKINFYHLGTRHYFISGEFCLLFTLVTAIDK
jgi:hypothetical protein